jgi:AbrB family looped-hinge helix DNA binding protein
MVMATVTSKGQVTIPVEVRKELGLEQGDRVEFVPQGDGFLMRASSRGVTRLAGFFGPHRGPSVSVEQMDRDIAESIAE